MKAERYYCLNGFKPSTRIPAELSEVTSWLRKNPFLHSSPDGWHWLAKRMQKEGYNISAEEIKKNFVRLPLLQAECLLVYSGIEQQRQFNPKAILKALIEKGIFNGRPSMKATGINNQILFAKQRLTGVGSSYAQALCPRAAGSS